ncbi:hypothetical protein PanWU01x14_070060 [Parasponia andersonii]|uniref:Uncharacterized protein n=1 Tax=Parasponia andersonii TaxID=3476 RepID=A0A2P5DEV3_PARAD|nr:hypothetical protein PanWU01x14_070060 [Parasponia andersonii]
MMTLNLRDTMDTLSQHEKEILIHPFPSDEIDQFRITYDYSKKLNSRFDDLGSIDDFDRLKKFLQIDCDSIHNLSKEIWFNRVRWEKEVSEKLDLRIATLKAELQRCEQNREELKTFKKSFYLEICLNDASKIERKILVDEWF